MQEEGYDSGDEHEYYIETQSGKRYRLEKLFADYDLNMMEAFKKIAERLPWAQVVDEVNQRTGVFQ